jgi:heptosyltransferase III
MKVRIRIMSLKSSFTELRHRLKPYPGHFRLLVTSLLRNLVRLLALRLRAWLTGRKLIVIGLPERMGDIVACTPFATWVRLQHPQSLIVWIARLPYHEVLRGNSNIDAVLSPYCITEWIWLKKFQRIYDQVYDLLIPPRCCEKCQHGLIKEGTAGDVTVHNYYDVGSLLSAHTRSAGCSLDEGDPEVPTSRETASRVDRLELPDRYVCIHTTSEDGLRNWQPTHWNRLIDHINAVHGLCVVELGLRSLLGRKDDGNYSNLCGQSGIAESAEIIRRAALFIGIDSGPSHLANAVKTPGVILLGRYLTWDYYMPYTGFYADARNCRILRHAGPASDLPLDLCLVAVDEILPALLDAIEDPQRA